LHHHFTRNRYAGAALRKDAMTTQHVPQLAAASQDAPAAYARLSDYYDEELRPIFATYKVFQHHLDSVQDELEACGALIRIGKLLYVHRARFWPEFRQAHTNAAQRRAAALMAQARRTTVEPV
jgi:hypothetical protein